MSSYLRAAKPTTALRRGDRARRVPLQSQSAVSALCHGGVQAVNGSGFAHLESFIVALRTRGAESLRGGIFVHPSEVVIDEVLAPVPVWRNRAPIGRDEPQRLVGFFRDAEATLVKHAMVIRAQQRQVLRLRLSTIGPVL